MYSREPTTHTATLGNVTQTVRKYSATGLMHIHSLYPQSHRTLLLSQTLKAISVKLAKKYGINGKFINSGKESIYRALQEALLIAKVRRQDEHKSEMIRTIIQKSHDGIIATNEENRIDRKSTRLNSSHSAKSRMPSSA